MPHQHGILAMDINWTVSSVVPHASHARTTDAALQSLDSWNISIGLCSLREELTFVWSISTRQYIIKLHSQPVTSKSHHTAPETQTKPLSSHSPPALIHENTFFSMHHQQLEPAVTWPAPQTYRWLLPAIPLAILSIMTFSHDTPAITGARPLLEDNWRTRIY